MSAIEALKIGEHTQLPIVDRQLGHVGLWGAQIRVEQLGVNDPLTHVKQYAEKGEEALADIDEDLVADLGERMVKPRFINEVTFMRLDSDFVSENGKFSMRSMTDKTKKIMGRGVVNIEQYKRSKIESAAVDRLNDWFEDADIDDVFIEESLPLDKERYSVVRLYRKADNQILKMYAIPLHNTSVETFNRLHKIINAQVPDSESKLELLDHMYGYKPDSAFEEFLSNYVAAHDSIMKEHNPTEEYSFGLSTTERSKEQDDIKMVRSQNSLRKIYQDALRAIAYSEGRITQQLLSLKEKLSLNTPMSMSNVLTEDLAQSLLDSVIQHIAATLNQAPSQQLISLSHDQNTQDAYLAARHFGVHARDTGQYFGGACPTQRGNGGGLSSELDALNMAFNQDGDCEFISKQCPNCKTENVVTHVTRTSTGKRVSGSCGCSKYYPD